MSAPANSPAEDRPGGLRRRDRMLSPEEFEAVYSAGGRARGKLLRVDASPNDSAGGGEPRSRVGLSIPKSFGSAVERNRARRRLRETFRTRRAGLPAGFDFILMPNRPVLGAPAEEVARAVVELCREAAGAAARFGGESPEKPGGKP